MENDLPPIYYGLSKISKSMHLMPLHVFIGSLSIP